jgi:hypothetical protein
MDATWIGATLGDAREALDELIAEVEAEPQAALATLGERLPEVYAKLNYAWHTRTLGPAALETVDHETLTAFPEDLP